MNNLFNRKNVQSQLLFYWICTKTAAIMWQLLNMESILLWCQLTETWTHTLNKILYKHSTDLNTQTCNMILYKHYNNDGVVYSTSLYVYQWVIMHASSQCHWARIEWLNCMYMCKDGLIHWLSDTVAVLQMCLHWSGDLGYHHWCPLGNLYSPQEEVREMRSSASKHRDASFWSGT